MTPEPIAIPRICVTLADMLLTANPATPADIATVTYRIAELRGGNGQHCERMAKLERLLDGLRETIARRKAAT